MQETSEVKSKYSATDKSVCICITDFRFLFLSFWSSYSLMFIIKTILLIY